MQKDVVAKAEWKVEREMEADVEALPRLFQKTIPLNVTFVAFVPVCGFQCSCHDIFRCVALEIIYLAVPAIRR